MRQVADALAGTALFAVRAWPRDAGHLLLDLAQHGITTRVAGQWFSDDDRAQRVAYRTAGAQLAGHGLVLQPGGADRRLTSLRELLRSPNAELVAHHPERRAVVRRTRADGAVEYTKVVRPDRLTAVLAAAHGCAVPGVRVPSVTSVDSARGLVTTAALPGRTVDDLLGDDTVPLPVLVSAGRACGSMVRALHDAPVPREACRHDPHAELAVARLWARRAREHSVLDGRRLDGLERCLDRIAHQLPGPPARPVRLHRDLHDKQVMVELRGREPAVGLIDFDLAAVGDPALDLANLLVHLDLRALQGHAAPERARACAAAVLDAYDPPPAVREALRGYAELTRLRLVAVYAFRPAHQAAVSALLSAAWGEPLDR